LQQSIDDEIAKVLGQNVEKAHSDRSDALNKPKDLGETW
jgi:hypothetical protein